MTRSLLSRLGGLARARAPFVLVRRAARPSVLMWHHGRCGSTALGTLLGQHSAIRWQDEIFAECERQPGAEARFDPIMRAVVRRTVPWVAGYEIKGLDCQHPRTMRRPLPEMIAAMQGYGLGAAIHLVRRNVLLKLVSVAIVRDGLVGDWHLRSAPAAMRDRRIRLDVDRVGMMGRTAPLLDMIAYVERGCGESLALLSSRMPTLSISYEDGIEADPTRAYSRVIEFLGLPWEPVTVETRKINTRRLADLLENYDEVRAALAGTPHAWMAEVA